MSVNWLPKEDDRAISAFVVYCEGILVGHLGPIEEYMTEAVERCPLCKGEHFQPFDRSRFRGFEVINHLCDHCGLVFQSPRMTDEELADFYASQYRKVYQGSEEPSEKDLAVQRARAQFLVDLYRRRAPVPDRYLDIGSSAGMLLQTFQSKLGSVVRGIEPGEAYRKYAGSQGLTVYPSLTAMEGADEDSFDLISLAHVLEHLRDPVSYLALLRKKYLHSDGRLLIEVPNLYVHDSFEIAHLISFSAHTLQETLSQAGFEVVLLKSHGHPRSTILNLYLTVLAQPAKQRDPGQVTPERGVRFRRAWGMIKRRIIQRVYPKQAWLPLPHAEEG